MHDYPIDLTEAEYEAQAALDAADALAAWEADTGATILTDGARYRLTHEPVHVPPGLWQTSPEEVAAFLTRYAPRGATALPAP